MARKVASCCEFFNVRTAWHGPGNVSPVGHAVNMHLDLATYNFGIQEQNVFSPAVREYIPRSQKFDFPELVQRLLANNQRVLAYESEAYWMDIGRPDDYAAAQELFANSRDTFLRTTS